MSRERPAQPSTVEGLSPVASDLLRADERVVYHERPAFLRYALPTATRVGARFAAVGGFVAVVGLAVGGVVAVLAVPALLVLLLLGVVDPVSLLVNVALVVVVAVALVVGPTLLVAYLAHRNAEYLVTTERVVRFGGVRRGEPTVLDRERVVSAWIDTNRVDETLDTAAVRIRTADDAVRFHGVDDPRAVAETVQS